MEGEVLTAVVLIPGNRVVKPRCREHVQVAIAVHVRGGDDTGAIRGVGDNAFGKGLTAVVLIPGNRVVKIRCREHVDVAIAVHVRGGDSPGAICGVGDDAFGEVLTAVVLIPGNRVVIVRCREHVDVAIAVHVRGGDGIGAIRGGGDVVGGEVLTAVVFIPGNRVVIFRCREHVQVAIAVHVRGGDRIGTVRGGGDEVFGEVLAAVVLIPGNRVVIDRCREHVQVAVAVHVRGGDRSGVIRGGGDGVGGETGKRKGWRGVGQRARPVLLNLRAERDACLDKPGMVFEIPVAAECVTAGDVVTRGDVGAGQLGDRVDQGHALRAARQVAAVEEHIAFISQGVAPSGNGIGILLQGGRIQPTAAQVDLGVGTVGDKMHGRQIRAIGQDFADLLDPVAIGLENRHLDYPVVVATLQIGGQLLVIGDVRADNYQLRACLGSRLLSH